MICTSPQGQQVQWNRFDDGNARNLKSAAGNRSARRVWLDALQRRRPQPGALFLSATTMSSHHRPFLQLAPSVQTTKYVSTHPCGGQLFLISDSFVEL